ncbi:NAD(P)-dependent oxidoreductase [Microlunatus parietis]|uniref:3-hydroxyisobutyrate dehydrogenase-like beta-hydroxyacid dehydrogenase n=1 Tax=Microlunatus parietis TaxID=682979 RepID=A0A7Y9I3U3_9ACTN|nr:NAD(P)-dependent oxidoreductase [Microlunatus parietis]NYE69742.1 3-hydroxyisobutyrate dehydrogenase-like beta-hydroxyacid dehydrogenase [Microlunatus parietis]
MTDDAAAIALVGLGNLGLPMANRLRERGHDVVGVDVDPDRRAAFAAGGGIATTLDESSPRPVLCLVVPDDKAVTALTEPDRLARLVRPGGLILMHSTVSPALAGRLGADCRSAGYGFVDAPVSGGAERAAEGSLTIMVGADADDHDRAEPLLRDLGSDVVHLGAPGAGSAAKLANQLMLFATLAGAYEAMELARGFGLTEEAVLRVVGTGTARSWVTDQWGFFDGLTRDYDAAGVADDHRPWAKDPAQAVQAARELGLDAPFAAMITDRLPGLIRRHADRIGEP